MHSIALAPVYGLSLLLTPPERMFEAESEKGLFDSFRPRRRKVEEVLAVRQDRYVVRCVEKGPLLKIERYKRLCESCSGLTLPVSVLCVLFRLLQGIQTAAIPREISQADTMAVSSPKHNIFSLNVIPTIQQVRHGSNFESLKT